MEKIKVYYDYQIMIAQKYGGISRYYRELIQNMNPDAQVKVRCLFSRNKYFENIFKRRACFINNQTALRCVMYLNSVYSLFAMRTCNIIHPTYYSPYILKGLKRSKQKLVLTVYDMIHELFPEILNDKIAIECKKKMMYAADHIIAISNNTKNDILKLYPDIPEDKISVIYIGSNFGKRESLSVIPILPSNYVLFVGNRDGYKNFVNFWKAMSKVLSENDNLDVVCVGGGPFTAEEKNLIGEHIDRVKQIDMNDDVLSYAYTHAKCFVFPSLYEGFGIPTLEAFACDCPVLLSNTSSFPEVGGQAAQYFDPYDIEDIKDKIEAVVADKEKRKRMIGAGREQLKKFDWKEVAQQTYNCYKEILQRG